MILVAPRVHGGLAAALGHHAALRDPLVVRVELLAHLVLGPDAARRSGGARVARAGHRVIADGAAGSGTPGRSGRAHTAGRTDATRCLRRAVDAADRLT